MSNISTSCKGCMFADYRDGKQIGCSLDRIEKFNTHDNVKLIDNNFVINDRFCNTYRPSEWLLDIISYDDEVNPIDCVMMEVVPRIGFVISFNDSIYKLARTLESIRNQEIACRYVVVINEKPEFNKEIFDSLGWYFGNTEIEYNMMQLLVEVEEHKKIDEAFKHAKNGWICSIPCGEVLKPNFISIIHNRINVEMRRLSVAYDDTKYLVQAALFKLLNGNHPKMIDENEVDNRSFFEKLSSLKTTDPDSIVKWKDLFNE